ncbi:MAG: hypothetical protein AB7F40_05360 [Victivallaceae bacterium]|nr:hypothetical protein [Victivallaceae bacterium]
MQIKISAVLTGLMLGFFAWAARGNGYSYQEMARQVPTASPSALYLDYGAVASSGWYEKLVAMPGLGDILSDAGDLNGGLMLFGNESLYEQMAIRAFPLGYDLSLDRLLEDRRECYREAGIAVKLTRYELSGHPALSIAPSSGGVTVYFVQLNHYQMLIAFNEQVVDNYLKLSPEQLGINPELEARLAPNADNVMFGSFASGAVGRHCGHSDVYATLDRDCFCIRMTISDADGKIEKFSRRELAWFKNYFVAGLNVGIPGAGDVLKPAIEIAAENGIVVIKLNLSGEFLEKYIAKGSALSAKNSENQNMEVENEKD